jgi:hypothetical protein
MSTPIRHPNVHAAWSQWSEDQLLHVVTVYFNPLRYRNRRQIAHNFIDHMRRTPNVHLQLVEVAFGDRPFEVSTPDDIQLRTSDMLWLKENALNIGISRFPDGWKYGAYCDCDFHFTRHDWTLETIHQLQHYDWVQLFSGYSFMSEDHRPITNRPGFAYVYNEYFHGDQQKHTTVAKEGNYYGAMQKLIKDTFPGATGGAWAFTKPAFDATRGLLETCILGAADWYMSFGLVGNSSDNHPEIKNCSEEYVKKVRDWQTNAFAKIKGNIGYVSNFASHEWHGDITNRGYGVRWQILRDYDYNPITDIVKDSQGLIRWAGNKPKLEQAVRRYFLSRSEDSQFMKNQPLF